MSDEKTVNVKIKGLDFGLVACFIIIVLYAWNSGPTHNEIEERLIVIESILEIEEH